MNRKVLFLFALSLLGLGIWSVRKSAPSSSANPKAQEISRFSSQSLPPKNSQAQPTDSTSRSPSSNRKELTSLEDMSRTLFEFSRPQSRLEDLIQYLESSRQQPLVTRDSNPDTGEMTIVRTKKPLPGTRYFHAQYFSDGHSESFLQHMSFEFQPSATAMNQALQSLEKNFPGLPEPQIKSEDFIQWNLQSGYILWVKKMKAEELVDDPFNAYTSEDAGTVRVALELEIHGDEHSSR